MGDHPPPPEKLGLNDLNIKGAGVSTYLVKSDIEEAIALGAHSLTKAEAKVESCFALRIRFSDLQEAGIGYTDAHLGCTGVVSVDYAHHDLIGSQPQMAMLAGIILKRIREGQDRVRRMNAYQVKLSLSAILDSGPGSRPSESAELCERLLGDTAKRDEARTKETRDRRESARLELSAIQIPDHVIRRRAYQVYEDRRASFATAEQDWFEALASLRGEYSEHYFKIAFIE